MYDELYESLYNLYTIYEFLRTLLAYGYGLSIGLLNLYFSWFQKELQKEFGQSPSQSLIYGDG
jgi:hypothetical protein